LLPFLLVFFLSSVAGRASRDSRGKVARPTQPTRGGVSITDEIKSNGKRWHDSSATQASHSLSEAVFLRARVEAGDLNVHGRQSKPGFHFNANMAIYIRISEMPPESVRFWHLTDIDAVDEHVRFWG
jgi:hypothetical protein